MMIAVKMFEKLVICLKFYVSSIYIILKNYFVFTIFTEHEGEATPRKRRRSKKPSESEGSVTIPKRRRGGASRRNTTTGNFVC